MMRGGWAFRLELMPGELLSSYLARCARAHGSDAYRFLSVFWPGRPIWNRDIDRTEDRAWLEELSVFAGVDRARLEGASLSAYVGTVGVRDRVQGDVPLLLSASIYHRTRRRHALQYCPGCLAQGDAWFRKIWRFGFLLACGDHGDLRDACPRCDAPVVFHRSPGLDFTRCHVCRGSLLGPQTHEVVREGHAGHLQGLLVEALPEFAHSAERIASRDRFQSVRALVAVATQRAAPCVNQSGPALRPNPGMRPRLQFERARWSDRLHLLRSVGALLSDWPDSFRCAAAQLGLTQRTFARRSLSGELADEVARLPVGQTRRREWRPLLFDSELRRLQRADPARARALRAERLLRIAGKV